MPRSGNRRALPRKARWASLLLIQWVEQEFKSDPACIAHALRVFQYAKELVHKSGRGIRASQ